MIDIVYPLGAGSKWDNNELRYSLRSVEKYIHGINNVYIIGQLPPFLQNVKHIHFDDAFRWKETRIALKVLKACAHPDISEDFLFMNDDHFLLRHYQAENFPFYYKENLSDSARTRRHFDSYRKSLTNTYAALDNKGFQTYNFDVHCPIVYNKIMFREMFKTYPWEDTNYGYVVKSMYCNTHLMSGPHIQDLKICNPLFNLDDLRDQIKDRSFFSIGDRVLLNDKMSQLLEELYPEKSKYEK